MYQQLARNPNFSEHVNEHYRKLYNEAYASTTSPTWTKLSMADKTQTIGTYLYHYVTFTRDNYVAPKITGMMIDVKEENMVNQLFDLEVLEKNICDALSICYNTNQPEAVNYVKAQGSVGPRQEIGGRKIAPYITPGESEVKDVSNNSSSAEISSASQDKSRD